MRSASFFLSASLSVCMCVWMWVRVGGASGGLNHTVWALCWMDRAWLRAERVLYASTHTLPGPYTLLNPFYKLWSDERRHANTSKIPTTAGEKKREWGGKAEETEVIKVKTIWQCVRASMCAYMSMCKKTGSTDTALQAASAREQGITVKKSGRK